MPQKGSPQGCFVYRLWCRLLRPRPPEKEKALNLLRTAFKNTGETSKKGMDISLKELKSLGLKVDMSTLRLEDETATTLTATSSPSSYTPDKIWDAFTPLTREFMSQHGLSFEPSVPPTEKHEWLFHQATIPSKEAAWELSHWYKRASKQMGLNFATRYCDVPRVSFAHEFTPLRELPPVEWEPTSRVVNRALGLVKIIVYSEFLADPDCILQSELKIILAAMATCIIEKWFDFNRGLRVLLCSLVRPRRGRIVLAHFDGSRLRIRVSHHLRAGAQDRECWDWFSRYLANDIVNGPRAGVVKRKDFEK